MNCRGTSPPTYMRSESPGALVYGVNPQILVPPAERLIQQVWGRAPRIYSSDKFLGTAGPGTSLCALDLISMWCDLSTIHFSEFLR